MVVYYVYDAWGNLISMTDTSGCDIGTDNVLRYRGYVYDEETGLYYLQSRYYNPEIGRFINADTFVSTGQGLLGNNMFAYCGNNPVNFVDKHGEEPLALLKAWTGSMWWLCGADTVLPIGDIIYVGGIIILGVLTVVTVDSISLNENIGITYYSPHSTNKSKTNKNKHEEGDSRRKRDQGGEKKKQKNNWIPNKNKRNYTNQSTGRTGVWRIDRLM